MIYTEDEAEKATERIVDLTRKLIDERSAKPSQPGAGSSFFDVVEVLNVLPVHWVSDYIVSRCLY